MHVSTYKIKNEDRNASFSIFLEVNDRSIIRYLTSMMQCPFSGPGPQMSNYNQFFWSLITGLLRQPRIWSGSLGNITYFFGTNLGNTPDHSGLLTQSNLYKIWHSIDIWKAYINPLPFHLIPKGRCNLKY